MDKMIKNMLLQVDNVEYVHNTLGNENWIQVSGHKDLNSTDAGFWCGFVKKDKLELALRDVSWDVSPSSPCGPGFEQNEYGCQYKSSLLEEGFEALLYYRDFYGVEAEYVELSQEFILLNNLRYDTKTQKYYEMLNSGEREEAVRYIDNTTLQIKRRYLLRYAAAKQLAVLLYFDIRAIEKDSSLSDFGLEEFASKINQNNLFYDLCGRNSSFPKEAYSRLLGKKIIMPRPIEDCGYWPYETQERYEEFIIGEDENGKVLNYTCNPDLLGDCFGANPEAPLYLTPVFFKREVLQKYISKPELYEIRDGYLGCKQLWGVEIDNHYKNCVSVYLGDLGRDLPEEERAYWKSYNIVGEESLSKVSIQRDFFNISAESDMADHRFLRDYALLQQEWNDKYGWRLFVPLKDNDKYNLNLIRIPLTNSQSEFDQLVLSLVKVMIDSLNEQELKQAEKENIKGISKFEEWLKKHGAESYEEHIQFLRDLQELRSTGTGHRKGKSYEKISAKFGIGKKELITVFESILVRADNMLVYLRNFLVSE